MILITAVILQFLHHGTRTNCKKCSYLKIWKSWSWISRYGKFKFRKVRKSVENLDKNGLVRTGPSSPREALSGVITPSAARDGQSLLSSILVVISPINMRIALSVSRCGMLLSCCCSEESRLNDGVSTVEAV